MVHFSFVAACGKFVGVGVGDFRVFLFSVVGRGRVSYLSITLKRIRGNLYEIRASRGEKGKLGFLVFDFPIFLFLGDPGPRLTSNSHVFSVRIGL